MCPLRAVLRVLLADDYPGLREILTPLLNAQSDILVVGQAASGVEALTLAYLLHPDVILMDAGLPGMNGVEAARRIREDLPDTRIIGLAVHGDDAAAAAMLAAGAETCLSRSALEHLLSAIRRR